MALPWGFSGGLRGRRRSICILACCIAGSLRTAGAESGRRQQGKEDPFFFDGDTGTAWPGEEKGESESESQNEEEEEEEEQQRLLCRRRSRRRKKSAAGMGMSVSKAFVGMKALLYEDNIANPATTMKTVKKKKMTKRVCRKRETEQQTVAMACPNPNCPSSSAFSSSSSRQLFLSNSGDERQRSEWPVDGKIPSTTNGARRNPSCCGSSLQFSPFNGDKKQQQQHRGEDNSNGNNDALEWLTESIPSMTNRACPNPSSSLQFFSLDNGNERQQQWQQQRGGGGRGEESEWPMEPCRRKVLSAADMICRIPSLCGSPLKLFPPSRDEWQQQQRGGDAASEWTLESLQEGLSTATIGKACGNLSFASPLQLFPFGRGKQQRGDDASEWPVEFLQGQIPLTEKGGTKPSFAAASLQLFPLGRDEQQRGGNVSEWPTAFLLGQTPLIDRTCRNPSSSMQLFPLDRDDEKQQREEEDVSEWPKETLREEVLSIDRDGRNPSFARTSQLFPPGRGEQQQGGGEEAPEWPSELCQGKVLSTNKLILSVRDEGSPNWISPLELFPVTSSRDGPLAGSQYHFGSSSGSSHIERETEEEKVHFLSSVSARRSPDHSSSFELFPLDRGSASGSSARGIDHSRGKGVLEWPPTNQEQVLGRATGTSNCSSTLKVFPIDGDEESDSGWVKHRRDTEGPSEWTFVEREYNQGQCEISNYSSSSLEIVPIDEGEDSEGGWVKYQAGNQIYYEFGRGMKRERELDQGQVITGRVSGGISNCSSSSLEIFPINGDNSDEVSESGGRIEHQGGEEEYALDWPTEREMEGECNQGQSRISNNSSSSEVFPIDGDDRVLESNGIGYRREERELDQGQVIIGKASRNPSSSSSSSSSSLSELSSLSSESAIIPGLNEDTVSRCIAFVSRSAYGALSLTSKGLWQLIWTGRIFKLRREMGVKEPWIYMYAQGGDGVPMMMAAGAGDSASPWRAFDPSERKWLTLPPSPADFSFLMSDKESLAAGTHLLWMGHDILGYSIFRYDLVSHTWARGPSMNSARCLFASASSSIYGYVAGGNLDGALLKSVERYNSELEQWERLPDMNHARHNASGCYMDGKFYVIGGCDNKWKPLEKSEVFDPVLGTWTEIPSMLPEPPLAGRGSRSHWSAPPLIAVVNDNLYSIDPVQNAIQIYRKADNTWHTLGLAPVQTDVNFGWGLAFKGVGDNLIVIGGYQDPKGSRGMAIFAWNPVLAGGNPPNWTMLTFMIGGFNSFLCNCAVMSC